MRIRFGLILKITERTKSYISLKTLFCKITRITSEIITLFRVPPQLFLVCTNRLAAAHAVDSSTGIPQALIAAIAAIKAIVLCILNLSMLTSLSFTGAQLTCTTMSRPQCSRRIRAGTRAARGTTCLSDDPYARTSPSRTRDWTPDV